MLLIFSLPAPVSTRIKGVLGVFLIEDTMSGMAFTLDDDDDETGQEVFCLYRFIRRFLKHSCLTRSCQLFLKVGTVLACIMSAMRSQDRTRLTASKGSPLLGRTEQVSFRPAPPMKC